MPRLLLLPLALLAACSARPRGGAGEPGGMLVEGRAGRIAVLDEGDLFTEYVFEGQRVPCLYPLLAPGGVPVTRGFPLEPQPGEPEDHPQQVSLWLAHGDVNGHDFWQDPAARIENGEAILCDSGSGEARIRGRNLWVAGDDLLLVESRSMAFRMEDDLRAIDFDVRLSPAHGPVTFGDTRDGTFAVRLRPELGFGPGGAGTALNSEGERDAGVAGKRARWVAYAGEIEGKELMVAVLDHPKNPRHPPRWQASDYGLCAANPFGLHAFEDAAPAAGALRVEESETLRLRYRVVIFRGGLDADAVEDEWQDLAGD
jgi:hypothetical protein